MGETTATGADFERQLSLSHSAYLAVCNNQKLSIFVGLNRVSEDGRTGYYYWFFMIPDEKIDSSDHWTKHASRAERLERALKGAEELDDKFTEIIKKTPVEGIRTDSFSFRDAEVNKDALSSGRVTLLGDAAHPMAPCKFGSGRQHMRKRKLTFTHSPG